MAITESFDPAAPAGSDNPQQGDDQFRSLKKVLYEWLRNGGHKAPTSGPSLDDENGRHVCGIEQASGGAGSPEAGVFYIYANDGSTRIVEIRDSSAAVSAPRTASQVYIPTLAVYAASLTTTGNGTIGGNLAVTGTTASTGAISGPNVTSGANPGHTHEVTLAIQLPAASTGVVAGVYFENRSSQTLDILGGKLVCGTAPGGNLTVQVYRLASGYTNPGSGGTAVFSSAPTIASARVGSESTSLDAAQDNLATGDALYFDVTALNGAADIVLYLRCRKA